MHGFLQKIQSALRDHGLWRSGQSVVAMVSGGPDSVALARALHRLNVPLSLVYVDHGTRPETAEEGRFVLQLGEQLGVSASVVYCEPASGSEQDLRDARYAAVSALPGDALATGHTLSDQAETVLLRMIRGAGIVGLAGIPWRRERIIRPMLGITREHVLAWLAHIDQPYRTDPTNASLDPTRNRVRHRLMPMLSEEFNPQIARSLARLADAARSDRDALEALAEAHVAAHGGSISALLATPAGLWPHVLRKLCSTKLGPTPIPAERMQAILRLLTVGSGTVQLEGGGSVTRTGGEIRFSG